MSHHLAILKNAGLLAKRVDGNTHWYRLDLDALRRINRSVFSADLSRVSYEADGQVWEREILHNFIEDDRLSKIPDTRKKHWVVLKWLAGRFALDSRHSEAEVNAVLKRYHPDAATLRRELVGYRCSSGTKESTGESQNQAGSRSSPNTSPGVLGGPGFRLFLKLADAISKSRWRIYSPPNTIA